MSLLARNDELLGEFRRITGHDSALEFPAWICAMTRALVRSLSENPIAAGYIWGGLTKDQRHAELMRHLRAQPPANWPDIRIVDGDVQASFNRKAA